MKGRILITDDVHQVLLHGLEKAGYMVDYLPNISAQQVYDVIHQYTGLIINSKVYAGKELIDKAPLLQFIGRAGSGLEVMDTTYAKGKGIYTINSPEGNRNAVAEHALGMLLSLMNNVVRAHNQVLNFEWKREENRGHELSGKTVALIAYGNTAQAFAQLLRGFDVSILAYDKYLHGFGNDLVREASLQEIYEKADVLSLHLPLTAETNGMIDYSFLSSFSKRYWLINTSRGKVLYTNALLQCIQEGRVAGAALDVLENEKPDTYNAEEKQLMKELTATQKVIFTPHIAGWTHESKQKIAETLLQKINFLPL